jgi:hypothetical protein
MKSTDSLPMHHLLCLNPIYHLELFEKSVMMNVCDVNDDDDDDDL